MGPPPMGPRQFPHNGQAQMAPSGPQPPKIYFRADKEAYLDFRIILPNDVFPKVNFAGRIIGHQGATINELKKKHNCKLYLNTDNKTRAEDGFDPSTDPPHVRVQMKGPLSEIMTRMGELAEDLNERFQEHWVDPQFDPNKLQKNQVQESETKDDFVEEEVEVEGEEENGEDGDEAAEAEEGSSQEGEPANKKPKTQQQQPTRGRGRGRGAYNNRGSHQSGYVPRGGPRGGGRGGYSNPNITPRFNNPAQGFNNQSYSGGAIGYGPQNNLG